MNYLFIMGVFRSGTSLLTAALDAHEDILVGWQPYMPFFKSCRDKFFNEILNKKIETDFPMGLISFRSHKEKEMFREIFHRIRFTEKETAEISQAIKDYLAIKDEKINQGLKPSGLIATLGDIRSGNAGYILEELLERFYRFRAVNETSISTENKKKVWIGIKEIFCEEFIEPILDYFGTQAKVLHLMRDPRAIVASRNYGQYVEAAGGRYPLAFIINNWKRSFKNYHLNKQNKNYRLIKYEDMVRYPEEKLREICTFLEIEYADRMKDFSNYRNAEGKPWQSNSSFGDNISIYTSSIDRWNEILTLDEIRFIEYHCREEMLHLEYPLTHPTIDADTAENFHEDISQIKEGLKKYIDGTGKEF